MFSVCNPVWIGQDVQNKVSVERSISLLNLLLTKSSVKGVDLRQGKAVVNKHGAGLFQ